MPACCEQTRPLLAFGTMFPCTSLRNPGCLILLSFVEFLGLSCGGISRPDFSQSNEMQGQGGSDGETSGGGSSGGDTSEYPRTSNGGCIEGTTRSCAVSPLDLMGACAAGTAVCDGGEWKGCPEPKDADSCEAGNDDNCDGIPNEECPCVTGDRQECGHPDVGVCKPGQITCVDGEWSSNCEGGIEPALRDCFSPEDNDCDGKADNTLDDVCKCVEESFQNCEDHPGMDGVGPCKAGTQTCEASADKTSSSWGACSGSVGPQGADTCQPGNDNDCDGTPNDTCECPDAATQSCDCGGTQTCQNGMWSACSIAKIEMWTDADGDMYGNANAVEQVCPGATGYATNGDDCHDGDPSIYPGSITCEGSTLITCPIHGGTAQNQTCVGGCSDGGCQAEGTVSVAGRVTCTNAVGQSFTCEASVGCCTSGCGCSSAIYCDGPKDCSSNETCYVLGSMAQCETNFPGVGASEVCDPVTPRPGCNCERYGVVDSPMYTCQ